MGKSMGKRGYARKRDENEPGIVKALELAGAMVYVLDKPVDLLVGFFGIDFQLEIKNGNQPPSWQRVTDDQAEHIFKWTGRPVTIVTNMREALEAVGVPENQADSILARLAGDFTPYGAPRK